MNRIFSKGPEGGWPDFPKRSYARLDNVETGITIDGPQAVFSFDAVDADWDGFTWNGPINLADPRGIGHNMDAFWRAPTATPDPLDRAPIYNIEISLTFFHKTRPFWGRFPWNLALGDWVEIRLDPPRENPNPAVEVYGSLQAPAVPASLRRIAPLPRSISNALTLAFDFPSHLDSSDQDIKTALSAVKAFEKMVAYDVGQGSAVGLLDDSDDVQMYFDLGAGAYGNFKTRPGNLRFCWRNPDAPIVLSHWDTDHWAGENADTNALAKTWIAPRQSPLGPRHRAFGGRIVSGGGTLMLWNPSPGHTLNIPLGIGSGQTLTLKKCSGTSRNGSGIACFVDNDTALPDGRSWLLTGDAGYSEIGTGWSYDLAAVTAPHHGADMSALGAAPSGLATYTRLLYSFGPDNTHGKTKIRHPTLAGMALHSRWNHGTWLPAAPGDGIAGQDVLATASHTMGTVNPPAGPHLDGATAGWTFPPPLPLINNPCSAHALPCHCTAKVGQN